MKLALSFAIGIIILFGCQSSNPSAGGETLSGFFDHMYQSNPIPTKIFTDLQLIKSKSEAALIPAIINLPVGGVDLEFEAGLSPRGVTRKKYCDFPPLRIELKREWLADLLPLESYSDYKLVTHCKNDSSYPTIQWRELLAYRLYEIISPFSLRVQPLHISYHSVNGEESIDADGFIIEHIKDLRRRTQTTKASMPDFKKVDKENYSRLVLFQFMIGNTDWSITQEHNLEFVEDAQGKQFVIPYDFDYSGLVNAHYAIPHPQLPIDSVRERMLQFRGKQTSQLETARMHFIQRKQEIFATLERSPEIIDRQDVNNYIEDFYEIIEEPRKLELHFEALKEQMKSQ